MFGRLNQLTSELQTFISSLEVDCVDAAGARRLVEIAERVGASKAVWEWRKPQYRDPPGLRDTG